MTDSIAPTSAPPEPVAEPATVAIALSEGHDTFLRRFARNRLAVAGALTFALIALVVLVGPLFIPYGAETIDLPNKNLPPTAEHIMGTDALGRDLFARVLDGGRLTLAVALIAVAVSLTIGLITGVLAGYFGGWVDSVLMRITDVFYSLPSLFVVILLVALVGAGFASIVIAIAAFSWMTTTRLVRASFLSLKEKEFVSAVRGLGASNVRIAFRHILPNAVGPIVVSATLGVAAAVLTESALSFLGLGFQAPQATWGGLLQEAQRGLINDGLWWQGFFPGAMIFLVILSVNFLGDGLDDAFAVRRRMP